MSMHSKFLWALYFAAAAVSNATIVRCDDNFAPVAVAPFDSKTAKQHQQAWAKHLHVEPGMTNSIGMKLVLIPAGEFLMGSPDSEAGRQTNEKQHRITLSRPYYLGRHEVTQKQWKVLMQTTPWDRQEYTQSGDDYPATWVSFADAVTFCKRLSARESILYELPTEAEWEFAARAGVQERFSFGDSDARLADFGWFETNANSTTERYPHAVGLKQANPFGLQDMHGNVSEWCMDLFDENYYARSPATDPQSMQGRGGKRTIRGGCWTNLPANCRSAARGGVDSTYRHYDIGFRVLRRRKGEGTVPTMAEVMAQQSTAQQPAAQPEAALSPADRELRDKLIGTTWAGNEISGQAPNLSALRKKLRLSGNARLQVRIRTEYDDDGTFGGLFEYQAATANGAHGMWGQWSISNGEIVHRLIAAQDEVFSERKITNNKVLKLDDKTLKYEYGPGRKISTLTRQAEKIDSPWFSKKTQRISPERRAPKKVEPEGPEKEADIALKKQLIGQWDGVVLAGIVFDSTSVTTNVTSSITYKKDGSFHGVMRNAAPGRKPTFMDALGTWTVRDGILIHSFTGGMLGAKGSATRSRIVSIDKTTLKYEIGGGEATFRRGR